MKERCPSAQQAEEARASNRQTAQLRLRAGGRARFDVTIEATPTGLLSIGALVAGILLSTAVVVRAAVGDRRT